LPGPLAAKVTKSWPNPLFKGSLTGGKPLLCLPSTDGGATGAAGPFPLAILAPGFSISAESYETYCAHLATWGFVVVLRTYDALFPDHSDEAAKTSDLIDWLATADSGLADRIDFSRIGVAGHSLGGKTSVYAAILDARIGAVAAWDPVDCGGPAFVGCPDNLVPDLMGGLTAPLALLGETTDEEGTFISPACAPKGENYQAFYDASPVPTHSVTIVGANHTSFTGSTPPIDPCKKSTADVALVRSLTKRVTVAHFLAVLDQNAEAAAWLDGAEMQSLVGLGLVTLQSK
jgi:dienelactone hydrolase